jgi:hypothetical protein
LREKYCCLVDDKPSEQGYVIICLISKSAHGIKVRKRKSETNQNMCAVSVPEASADRKGKKGSYHVQLSLFQVSAIAGLCAASSRLQPARGVKIASPCSLPASASPCTPMGT